MDTQKYAYIKHVVELKRNVGKRCEECDEMLETDELAVAINHYLAHGYVVLHIGSVTERDSDTEELWQFTVAILGK